MKKILFLLLLTLPILSFAQLSENMGTPSSTTPISTYTGWQNNSSYTFTGTGDVRTSVASSGYTGASGNGNVFLTNSGTGGFYLQIGGINTSSLTNPAIKFGLSKSTTASDASELKFEYSTDGSNFTQIATPTQATGSGTTSWKLILITGLPNSSTLTIRFTNTTSGGTGPQFRLDDIQINSLSVLPISLTSFTGKALDKNILLNWNTASEENNDYFDVQHSADGKTFTSIGKVAGAGTSTTFKDYLFTDENPFAGTNYYKLVQHDFDGKTTESKVIGVASNIAAATLSVYASSSDVKITLSSPNKTEGTFEVFDIGGRKLATTSLSVNKGYNTVSVPVSLQPGVHFVKYTADGETINVKFVR